MTKTMFSDFLLPVVAYAVMLLILWATVACVAKAPALFRMITRAAASRVQERPLAIVGSRTQ